jgi:uncharacterized protein
MYKRTLEDNLQENISSFLFGPRQCGKTTILRSLKPDLYLDLLKTKEFIQYNRNPSIFFDEIQANATKINFVVIDEIQRVPLLLDEVQRCTDQFPHIRFILSGSSARKLKRGGANLLGGRFADYAIFPLSIDELGDDFDLQLVMTFGSLPKIYTLLKQGQKRSALQLLRSYVSTYLSEEIKAEALVRHLDHFQRFLEVSAQQFAREVNQSELADQAQISVSSVKNYYGILEDTMIGFFLFPYSTSIRKQLTKTPKFYFFDNGVVRAIQGMVNSEPSNQEKGYLFEQMMIQEAVRINRYLEKDLKLTFWRTTGGAEVDLVFSKGNKIVFAVEFKSSPHINIRDLSGLKSFAEEYPKVPKFLCAPIERTRILDQFSVLTPAELFNKIRAL